MASAHDHCPVCMECLSSDEASCASCGHGRWFRLRGIDSAIIITVMPGMSPEKAAIDRVGGLIIDSRAAPHIIINLAFVRFFSTTFVRRLSSLAEKISAAHGKLTLCGASPAVQDILRLMNTERMFVLASVNGREAIAA